MYRVLLLTCLVSASLGLLTSNATAHSQDKDCVEFSSQRAAQDHHDTHSGDPDGLDYDNDGVACEELPCPCGATVLPPPTPTPMRSAPIAPLAPLTTTARVAAVVDGDTLTVKLPAGDTVDVGLIGVAAPERRGRAARPECGAQTATARMRRLAFRNGVGRTVKLKTDPTLARADRADRRLAYVDARGVDLGRTMISSGWAKVDGHRPSFLRVSTYRRAQAAARAAGRGAWRGCSGADARP